MYKRQIYRCAHLFLDAAASMNRWPHLFTDAAASIHRWPHLFIDAAASIHRWPHLFIDAAIYKIDFLKFNLLSNGLIEKFWDTLWLRMRPILCSTSFSESICRCVHLFIDAAASIDRWPHLFIDGGIY